MNTDIQRLVDITKDISPKSFINSSNELIIVPKINIYFRLEDVKNELDFKCKVIAWLSRPSHKGVSVYWQNGIRKILNQLLETNFSKDDMDLIYTYLGNDVNRPLCEKFIQSNYDLTMLREKYDAEIMSHSK